MKTQKPPRKVHGRKTRLGKSFAYLMSILIFILAAAFTWQIGQSREKPLIFALYTLLAVAGMIGMVWLIRHIVDHMDRFIATPTIEKVESPN
ncbi:MAG: hypothetical protein WCT37_02065 [Patescibacteria group bacterium]|jgi:hypothetical protein